MDRNDRADEESCSSSSLSTHSQYMRAALDDCNSLVERLCELLHLKNSDLCAQITTQLPKNEIYQGIQKLFQTAYITSGEIEKERELVLQNFQDKVSLDILHVDKNGWYKEGDETNNTPLTPSDFKQQYCFQNIPCIIRGLDQLHFKGVSLNWIISTSKCNSRINTKWFERNVGADTMVPVRIDGRNELDKDGRAEECETVMMSLQDWIARCEQKANMGEEVSSEYYLKDWHLVQLLQNKRSTHGDISGNDGISDASRLYETPECFERDLLNNFLEKYSDGGDFKFVYWGPEGSITRCHSDVLHSFSWSYNVTGMKKWTFYVPNSETGDKNTFEVIQQRGETIFVSSKIQHEVVNLVETLSINHNWITSANIDNTWQCICSEINAIDDELKEWGSISMDDFEARENMLRGCIGVDVTTFFFMILLEVLELFTRVLSTKYCNERNEFALSIVKLGRVLGEVSTCEETMSSKRLQAVLGSNVRAMEADRLATFAVDLINEVMKPISS